MKNKDKPRAAAEDRKRNDDLNKPENRPDEQKLPGEYPPEEDIMNRRDTQRVTIDGENFSRNIGIENLNNAKEAVVTSGSDVRRDRDMERPVPGGLKKDDLDPTTRNESDLTEEDLQALGPRDISLNGGEDEQLLKNRVWPVDMAGSDLDVPGAELDDDREAIGNEDEENNSYSLGDRHEE